MRLLITALAALLFAAGPALSQSATRVIIQGANGNRADVNSDGELEVTGGGGGGGAVTMAAGAVEGGAYVAGALVDGAIATLGALADAACATDNGTCSLQALVKRTNQRLTSLISSLGGTGTFDDTAPATGVALGVFGDDGLAAGTAGLKPVRGCTDSVAISTASSGNTQLVALTSGETVYVCGYMMVGAAAVDVQFITGTGSACATDETDLTGLMSIAAAGGGMADSSPFYRGLKSAVSSAFCIELSGNVQVSGILYYTKY